MNVKDDKCRKCRHRPKCNHQVAYLSSYCIAMKDIKEDDTKYSTLANKFNNK